MPNLEQALPWIEKADHDLGAAKILMLHAPEYWDVVAFHCQQAAEKYLKAQLVFQEMPFRRSHDLIYLLDLFAETDPMDKSFYELALQLEAAGVEFRYPEHQIRPTEAELKAAIEAVDALRKFILDKLET